MPIDSNRSLEEANRPPMDFKLHAEKFPASITISTYEIIMRENAEHIETPFKDIKIEAVQLVRSITERCSTETIPISQIYDQEIASLCGERFLLFDKNDQDRVIGLESNRGLEILQSCSQWHADATFKITPDLFYQCLIIHGFYQEQIFPCLFFLMVNKKEDSYDIVFGQTKEKALELNYYLNPTCLICDFELALINSFRFNFPGILIRGCQFHHSQAIFKKIVGFGLKRLYCTNEIYSNWLSKLMNLSFVPLNYVVDAFQLLKLSKPNDLKIDEIIAYFNNTWLEGQYDLQLWNHAFTVGPRTNNHTEGFHS
ncbi:unnamed protein product [Brachionus calyciflorus]|uniref:MULE transposase domain-containing protein n=1 Tax=Brachionus calyciflorus TaxID=104777 RepID=A0A814AES3_9BILA|nr:unnamed protein product [Brachionus calyciflorus]